MNRRLIVLVMVLVVSGIIAGGLYWLLAGSKDPTADINKAKELMAQGEQDRAQYMAAIQFLKSALGAGAQGRGDIWTMLAECYQKQPQPNYPAALDCMRNAAEREPGNPTFVRSYAEMLLRMGRPQDALVQAEKLLQLEPDKAEHQRLIAQVEFNLARGEPGMLEKRRHMEASLAAADKAIAQEPSDLANYDLKIALLVSGIDPERNDEYFTKAAEVARAAIEKCDDKVGATLKLAAICLQHAGMLQTAAKPRETDAKMAEATQAYRDALAIDPKNVAALLGLGNISMAQALRDKANRDKFHEEAEEHYRAAIAADPTSDAGYYGMAQLKAQQNRNDEALVFLRDAVAKCTPTAELTEKMQIDMRRRVLTILADILIEKGGQDLLTEARARVEELASMNVPEDASTVLYLRGRLAVRDGDLRQAQSLLQQAVGQRPENPEYHRRLAQVYQAQSLPGRALEEYDEALRLSPSRPDVRLERAQLLLTLRQFDQAEAEARRVMEGTGSYAAAMILAQSLASQGKYAESIATADQMIKASEKMPQGYLLKAQVLVAAGRPPTEALSVLVAGMDKVDQRMPLYEEARMLCARHKLTQEVEDIKKRIDADTSLTPTDRQRLAVYDKTPEDIPGELQRQMDEDPKNPDPVIKLATWRVREGKIDEALDLYRRAYDLALAAGKDKQVRLIWDNVWTLLLEQEGGREKAKEWIEKLPESMAMEREMANGLIMLVEGASPPAEAVKDMTAAEQAQYRLDRINQAVRVFKDLESRDELGTDVRIMRALGRAYYLLAAQPGADREASLAEAEKYYRNVVSLQPLDTQSQRSLLDVYLSMQDYARVVTQANELLKISPDDPVAMERMAQAKQMQGDRDEVVRLRRQMRTQQPQNTRNLYLLGQMLEQTGNADEAEKVYRDVLAIQPNQVDTSLALALLLARRGGAGRQEANTIMADLEQASPNDPVSLRAISAYHQSLRQFDKAVEYAKRAQGSIAKPTVGDVLFTVAAYENLADAASDADERTKVLTEAASLLQDFLKSSPDELAIRIQLADVLRRTPGRAAEAESLIRDIVKAEPKAIHARTLLARILLDKALTARANGRDADCDKLLIEARQTVSGVLNEQRDYGEARLLRGEIEMAADDLSEAETQLRQVPRGDPAYMRSLFLIVDICRRQGNRQTMTLTLGEILKIQPQHIPTRLQLADIYAAGQAYDRVERLMNEGLSYSPNNPQLQMVLCRALLMQNNQSKSQQALRIATDLTQRLPESPDIWATWASAMNALGRKTEATSKIEELAKQHQGGEVRTAIAFGVLLSQQYAESERKSDAKSTLEALISAHRKAPEVLTAYRELSTFILTGSENGQLAEAAVLLEQALKDFPLSAELPQTLVLARTLVSVYAIQNKMDESRKLLLDALKVAPRYTPLLVALGEHDLATGKDDEAIEILEKALKLDPSLWGARNNLAWIYATKKNEPAKAREQIDQALRLQPRHPSLLDTSGWVYYLVGDYSSAERDLEQSLKLVPSPITKYHLGMTLIKRSGETDAAAAKAQMTARAKALLTEFVAEDKEASHAGDRAEAEKVLKDM
ncbi:MAG: tetratricopeptide repeat protein [Planctomycetes bacterium]|nr:tetratricopeptide repeat protein [Planctomycetota bacterium]